LGGRPDQGVDISVNGCVSRSVRDTAAWLAATEQTGDSPVFPPVGVVTAANTQRLRIALDIPNALGHEPDPEVSAAVEAAATLCRSLGHTVSEGRPTMDGPQFSADFILLWAAGAGEVVELVRAQAGPDAPLDQLLEPLTLELAQHAASQGQAELAAAIGRLRQVEANYAAFFETHDLYLTPVLAKPPIPLGTIDGAKGMAVFATLSDYVGYTPLQNVAGAPAMSVPLAWSSGGLPIGVHFSAAKGQEKRLLELAYELEQAQPWASRKPGVSAGCAPVPHSRPVWELPAYHDVPRHSLRCADHRRRFARGCATAHANRGGSRTRAGRGMVPRPAGGALGGLGRAHYLRIVCDGRGDQVWRVYMRGVIQREPQNNALLVEGFNRGYRNEDARFPVCDATTRQMEAELRARGLRVAQGLSARHAAQ
jgi:hypothetical protein